MKYLYFHLTQRSMHHIIEPEACDMSVILALIQSSHLDVMGMCLWKARMYLIRE